MTVSPEKLLGYVPLMKSVTVKLAGIPRVFDPKFYTTTEETFCDKGRLVEVNNTRKAAKIAVYGSPPAQVPKMSVGVRDFKLLHSIETMPYSQEMLTWFQMWDKYEPQHKAFMETLTWEGKNFAARQDNLRTVAVGSNLAYGAIYIDADNNILPNSTGAALVVDQGVPAANKGTVGGIVAAPWSDPATDIPGQILALQARSLRDTGRVQRDAYYGANVLSYMARNTAMQAFFVRNPMLNQKFIETNTIPDGVLGLRWHPAQAAFFEDQNGTNQDGFPADQVTYTPEVADDWYGMYEGSYMVPTDVGIYAGVKEAFATAKVVYGMFRFGYVTATPTLTIGETHGDTFLPRFKVPNCVYLMDTTP